MAKAKKGLIISLLTLIIAIVVTTTSTYAWFAMNTEVTATNMQITAKADNTFLVIESSPSGTGDFQGKMGNVEAATLTITDASTQVLPTRAKTASDEVTLTSGIPTWQTAVGTSFTNGAAKNSTYSDVTTTNENKYRAKFTFYIGLNPYVSQVSASDLKIKTITITNSGDANKIFYDAVSVLVVADGTVADNYVSAGHTAASNSNVVAGSNTVLSSTVNADGTPIKIDVYVYIDGDNTNVKTANATAANLGTYTVDLAFEVTSNE